MNSTLKSVLPSSPPQNSSVAPQMNKPMQGAPTMYNQPSTHMPPSLVNLPTMAHSHPNPAHQSNHYSLNVPNAPHYSPSNIPASNHPVPNANPGAQNYSPNKNVPFSGGYQPNLGHPPNQNPVPPISQSLPATQPTLEPQSNGTSEVKSPAKTEENHVTPVPETAPPTPPPKEEAVEEKSVEEPIATKEETKNEVDAEKPASPLEEAVEEEKTETEIEEQMEIESVPEKVEEEEKPVKTPPKASTTRKARKVEGESPRSTKTPTQKSPVGTKRARVKTQPYQSPLPEIEIITKITSTPKNRNQDEKLIVFYKNEFLAVRNSEGGFYICQAVQNIYKSSPKIRIRWLSQDKTDKSGEVYTPDFYDNTDFDCILTNLNLSRVDKGRFRLPPAEKERTDSILKRSLAVEKGEVTSPSLTEEHPDGIDVSLYKEESQLKKRKGTKRKAKSSTRGKRSSRETQAPPEKVRKEATKPTKSRANLKPKRAPPPVEVKKPVPSTSSSSRTDRAKRRSDNQNHNKTSSVVDQKKAKVLAKVARKGTKVTTTVKTATKVTKKVVQKTPPKVVKKAKRLRK